MRVAVIAPPWVAVPPPGYGGTERVLDDLCRALVGQGHDVLLHATGDSTCPVDDELDVRDGQGHRACVAGGRASSCDRRLRRSRGGGAPMSSTTTR